jgi:hypothetical protein
MLYIRIRQLGKVPNRKNLIKINMNAILRICKILVSNAERIEKYEKEIIKSNLTQEAVTNRKAFLVELRDFEQTLIIELSMHKK